MSFRLVLKSVTLNDLDRRHGPCIALFHRNRQLPGCTDTVYTETFCDRNVAKASSFWRPFVKQFALCYRTTHCLSCLTFPVLAVCL